MENPVQGKPQSLPAVYDDRMFEHIWQRVSPELEPYPEPRGTPGAALSAPSSAGDDSLDTLPGAEADPCCMGTLAQPSINVVAGFIDEELSVRRSYLLLSQRMRQRRVRQLLLRIAQERGAAVRQLKAAYYLITGSCHAPVITMEQPRWPCLPEALRACYHQEACTGFNYQRAADEAEDLCLQGLLTQLSRQTYRRAEDILTLLGTVIH